MKYSKNFINFRPVIDNSRLPFYRTGSLCNLSLEDFKFITSLNIKGFFDLRTSAEIAYQGFSDYFENSCIKYNHIPMDHTGHSFFILLNPTAEDYGSF